MLEIAGGIILGSIALSLLPILIWVGVFSISIFLYCLYYVVIFGLGVLLILGMLAVVREFPTFFFILILIVGVFRVFKKRKESTSTNELPKE